MMGLWLAVLNLGESLLIAEEASGGGSPAWAPGYLVVILATVFVMMIALAPSRRSDKVKGLEFKGTSWGKVVTSETEKKKAPEGPPPGVFAPAQMAKKRG
ncbi:hypothetical protein [Thermogutta sp.]|uniref:hypothetical protein n=2 Tax=Thermogutta sp. TaxID=1962930 RepID=UPI0032209076